MSTGLENDLINTRGIGHAVCVAVTCLLWSFVVYLQQIGKLLCIWTNNQPTEVPTLRSDATCRRTSEGSIILLLLQEIASTCFKQKENYSSFTQSSGSKIPEFRSLDFASSSCICHSTLKARINWAMITSTICLILLFKYLSPIFETKKQLFSSGQSL